MLSPSAYGRYGRRIPLWIRCIALGLFISWVSAFSHFLLVEIGHLPRYQGLSWSTALTHPDEDFSGVAVVELVDRRLRGAPARGGDPVGSLERYHAVAYGWPIANWGSLFRERDVLIWQTGLRPVVAIDLRPIWPVSGRQIDPRNPTASPQNPPPPYPSGCPRPILYYDPYERYLPVFPLVGQSLLVSLLYGLPFYIAFRWRDVRRRRGSCVGCGYDLTSLAAATMCPECGKARSIRPAKKAVSPLT
jgi:hypothetical protein